MSNFNFSFNKERLYRILSLNRAHGFDGVEHLIRHELRGYDFTGLYSPEGAELAISCSTDINSRTLFVAHLDTAEQWDGRLTRPVLLDDNTNTLMSDGEHVLGADDGAGIAILLHMIDNGVPGTYLFTHGEEKGGIGAKGVAMHHADFLSGFDRAIAFDRRGTGSVITHQAMGRCCSDDFADALSTALDDASYSMFPDSTGVYTDTAEFTDVIGECTNISVGYQSEHSTKETLDMDFIEHLATKVLTVEWESLPKARTPGEIDPEDDYFWGYMDGRTKSCMSSRRGAEGFECAEDILATDFAALAAWVKKADPVTVAALLMDLAEASEGEYDIGYQDALDHVSQGEESSYMGGAVDRWRDY